MATFTITVYYQLSQIFEVPGVSCQLVGKIYTVLSLIGKITKYILTSIV